MEQDQDGTEAMVIETAKISVQVRPELTEHEVATVAKRVFNGAIRKLRAAVERGHVTPDESAAIRAEWYAGAEIPAEYLE